VVNGNLRALVLFGSMLFLGLYGPDSIDQKRARRFGAAWDRYAAVTSNVPFLAIAQGRKTSWAREIGYRLAFAVGGFAVIVLLHPVLGGNQARLPGALTSALRGLVTGAAEGAGVYSRRRLRVTTPYHGRRRSTLRGSPRHTPAPPPPSRLTTAERLVSGHRREKTPCRPPASAATAEVAAISH
jgi:hypothetical protein